MTPKAFIAHWSAASASERSNSQQFLCDLADLLGVERPHNNFDAGYAFEFAVKEHQLDGTTTERRIDLYKRGCFVLESKQFQAAQPDPTALALAAAAAAQVELKKKSAPVRGTERWDDAMTKARGQAERYIRALPASEPNPPFLLVIDVGDTIELYADFTQAGKAYLPFPDPLRFRIRLADLGNDSIRERLRLVWTDPLALDPGRKSAEVTRDIAAYLAELAKSYEAAGHPPQTVADFLSRCLFCMFAEDVGLLPKDGFKTLLEQVDEDGSGFQELLGQLFREMNTGTGDKLSIVLRRKLLQFNGGLFADDTVLPVNTHQLTLLRAAARLNWSNVEPAIFGTLLERALNPHERHKLGAHYTPRAYVERLVLPTVIEPLRAEWESVRTAALTHARLGKVEKAIREIRDWHRKLCDIKVLDPACGSGNFLYVTLEHMKRLEGEVLLELEKYGDRELTFELQHFSVDPHQFLGIEVNPRAASIAELVLWIGYLQWHFATRGQTMPSEPIIRKFKNIECRDAVLAWDGEPEPRRDEAGNIITVWDRRSYKLDHVTAREIPDESKRIPLLSYKSPRPAEWPQAEYIVGNPPFLGAAMMRSALGDGYVETLRSVYPEVSESTDFVLYWWHKAALLARIKTVSRFGLITTNSVRQTLSRRVLNEHLGVGAVDSRSKLNLAFAIPDHPWVDTEDGAAVRIAMTVGTVDQRPGELNTVLAEEPDDDGASKISFKTEFGHIRSDLRIGADIVGTVSLTANEGIAIKGFELGSQGFLVPREDAEKRISENPALKEILKPYMNGDDLTEGQYTRFVIDFHGLSLEEARQFPELYQWVLTRSRLDRVTNREDRTAKNWWLFRRSGGTLRNALASLPRFIGTTRTAKYRLFQFLPAVIVAESKIVVIASSDAFLHGVLSSRLHVCFSTVAGGWLGVGNDPTYNHLDCFNKFPFPDCTEARRESIRKIAEELDAHRKRVQAQLEGLTLTGMYNVLEKLRANQPLSDKEKAIHDKGLVSVLKQLHDDLDSAVFDAYGWPKSLTDAEILERLVALNAERAREEPAGKIRWLRPDYQIPLFQKQGRAAAEAPELNLQTSIKKKKASAESPKTGANKPKPQKQPWPKSLPERAKAVEAILRSSSAPVTVAQVAAHFRQPRYDHTSEIHEILETLCTFGRARQGKEKGAYLS